MQNTYHNYMKHRVKLLMICLIAWTSAFAQTGRFYPSSRFSSGLINSICQDRYGYMWIATDYGLNKFDGYRFTTYLHHTDQPSSLSNNTVASLFIDSNGQLWVGTAKGLDRFDYATEAFQHFDFPNGLRPRVTDVTEWKNGRLMACTSGYGLYELIDGKMVHPDSLYTNPEENGYYSQLMEDSRGRIWKRGFNNKVTVKDQRGQLHQLASNYGNAVRIIERDNEVLIICMRGIYTYRNNSFEANDFDLTVMGNNVFAISNAYKDSQNNIYLGTRGDGLFRLPQGSHKLERVDCVTSEVDLNTAKVWGITQDAQGNIWVGCQSKGLLVLPHQQPQFHTWSFAAQGISLSSTVTSVCESDNGIIWCTVQGNGVFGFDQRGRVVARPACPPSAEFIFRDRQKQYWIGTVNGLYAYNPLTGHSDLKVEFDCDRFNDMTCDDDGNIYISTYGRGFCIYNPVTRQLRNFSINMRDSVRGWICNDWVLAMMPDRAGRIWLATSNGVSCYDPKGDNFHPLGWHQLLNNVMCRSLCETASGDILIGTDQGLYIYKQGQTEAVLFNEGDALKDKVVGYIIQANNGDLWCSTPMGLWQHSVKDNKFIGHISGNGLTTQEYVNSVGLHTNDDAIYFANNDGLTVFRPSEVKNNLKELADVQLTAFLIGGHPVNTLTESNGDGVTDRAVIESDHFRVSYLDNSISLEFSLLDYTNPSNIIYEYRIGGSDWTQTPEGQNAIQLSHLQPGSYQIEVRALSAGIYSGVKTLTVKVTPPWYLSTWAYMFYTIGFLGLLGFIGWLWRRRTNQQLNEEKMKFLINATHDIRSPLTIILSALKKVKNATTAGEAVDTIEHNTQRILNLVNQILDVRKIDKQQMHLHCQETEMVGFIGSICKMFEFNAKERGISFSFLHDGIDQLNAWVDRSQFDKVVTNLLSNAFKYSNDGGEVAVELKSGESLQLIVTDNGVGLDEDNLKHLFERFYQGSNSRKLNISGTGIGLNLCKMIVDMHHGTIAAANRTDATGSVFTVTLPLGNAHLKPEELETASTESQPTQPAAVIRNSQSSSTKHRVLLVDDDAEIGNYISSELGRYYRFTLCSNGRDGLKELLTGGPYDAVVSDVMMPEMDGFTMLRMIKTNINVAHIPVIMLTSKAEVGNRLEGLENGADAFLAKPFDMDELHMVIENLIQGRQRLKGKYSGAQEQADKIEAPEVKGNDELLMERIMKAINKNLADSDFNVEMLTTEVGISRAQLHRKMKEMTGISTSEFIRNIRLEQAARLLKEQKLNITQVAYTVGFSNLAHFSTLFRKHFGVAPSEYANGNES